MTAQVIDILNGQPFIPSDPDADETPALPEPPQPPAGLSEAEERAWWDGYTACCEFEDQIAAARIAEIQRQAALGDACLGLRLVSSS